MNTEHDIQLNLTKLQMLQALTRSQVAIANILEQTAKISDQYQLPAGLIREQLRSLAGYQSTMITQLSGIQMKRAIYSKPIHLPWLNKRLFP